MKFAISVTIMVAMVVGGIVFELWYIRVDKQADGTLCVHTPYDSCQPEMNND